MPTKKPDPLLHVKDVALQIGVHYQTAARMAASGEFPNAHVFGEGRRRRYRIPKSDVDNYLGSLRVVA